MKLYNTLTKSIEEVRPMQPPSVTVYTCGPTVYDYAHIGHWFNYVRMDILIRTLMSSGFKPNWVMNITDVGHLISDSDEGEDKLQKAAKKEHKTAWDIAKFYTEDFLLGMKKMNLLKPDYMPKATDHINEQLGLIKKLETKDYTYIIDDGVYFDTGKLKQYDMFAQLDLDENNLRPRVEHNKQKKRNWDFALWKFSNNQKRDMEWDSTWGKGFPGWHIECSAMSMKYLGDTLDIHTGGIDHVPIHHTNEIAQSESATNKRYANYWMHSNHVLFENQKISKSLGNTIKISDVEQKGYSAEDLRLHILESHYRNQSKFSWDSLESASRRLKDLKAMAVLRYQAKDVVHDAATFSLRDIPDELALILQNDLNTPEALAFLSNISTQLQQVLIELDMVDHFIAMLEGIDQMLGLKLSNVKDISQKQKDLINERDIARSNKDFSKSDNIRADLQKQNIGLNDTEYGSIWYHL